jgi:hypothetical protein
VNGLSEVLDIVGRDTGNRDTTIAGKVDVPVVTELVNLLGRQSSVAEHTNLLGNMVPGLFGAKVVLKMTSQLVSIH